MENIAIVISYKASGGELKGLSEFQSELRNDFSIVQVKPRPGAQSGGLFDFILNLTFNVSWTEFGKNLIQEVQNDIIIEGAKLYVLNKIIKSLTNVKTSFNDPPDILSMNMIFSDVTFTFYGIDKHFTSKLAKIFDKALKLENVYNPDKLVSEITIPIYQESGNYYLDPYTTTESETYGILWGLEYIHGLRNVFDSESGNFIDIYWK